MKNTRSVNLCGEYSSNMDSFRQRPKMSKGVAVKLSVVAIFFALFLLSWGAIIYTVLHFIGKYW